MDQDERELLGFNDPTSLSGQPASPSRFRAIAGILLLAIFTSFGASLWDSKWGNAESSLSHRLFTPGQEVQREHRWDWEPYRTEYQLYYDRGYDLSWLETETMRQMRKFFGELFCCFELMFLRLWGFANYLFPLTIVFMFSVSAGSVRYHEKRFQFRHISSTFNNASIRIIFWAIPFLILWALVPFGVTVPFLGHIPILADVPVLGAVWVSSPGIWAVVFGAIYSGVGFILGANFSREI